MNHTRGDRVQVELATKFHPTSSFTTMPSILPPPQTPSRKGVTRADETGAPPASPTKISNNQPFPSPRDIRMDTAKGFGTLSRDIRMDTARGFPDYHDIRMETARGAPDPPIPSRPPLALWERELLESPEVKRKATVAQLCMTIAQTIDQDADSFLRFL